MKIKLVNISVAIFLCYSLSFGQNEYQFASEIDSIQELINANPQENQERVVLLNELARLYFYEDQVKEGFITTREALNLAGEIDFEGGRVMYYLTMSTYHWGEDEDMFIYYQKKAEWLSKSFANQSRNFFEIPVPPENVDRESFEERQPKYLDALSYFDEEADKEITANIMLTLARINFNLQNQEKTLEYLNNLIILFKEMEQVYPVFLCSTYKIQVLNSLGRLEVAKNIELDLVDLFLNIKDENAIGLIAFTMASRYAEGGRYVLSIEYYLKSIEEFERVNDLEMLSRSYYELGVSYENLSISTKAVESYEKCITILETLGYDSDLPHVYSTIIFPLISMGDFDEAQKYLELAEQDTITAGHNFRQARLWDAQGQILMNQKKYEEAIPYFKNALNTFLDISDYHWGIQFMYVNIAECYFKIGNTDEALSNALLCLERASEGRQVRLTRRVNLLISDIYEKLGNDSEALKYLKAFKDIVQKTDQNNELSRVADAEIKSILDKSQEEIVALEQEQELINQENKIQRLWLFSTAGALISALLLLYILFRNNRNKQKSNALLKQQKEKVESTLDKLKSAQTQLIQSEKMASLGELTAGIAHEIQNPLNFVNNFSEVNRELITELKEEIENGDLEEVKAIAGDLEQNEEKISHHGKRADGIVKGMLQHSRTNSGQKEPTDLNALADEYLRLAYHGLRAKDKSFNADFKLEADENLPKVNVVQQDIGRVILNLINNAFHAVSNLTGLPDQKNYKPVVTVSTKYLESKIEIRVADNGPGIPEEIRDKIFQPFFTTKPTGEGTGLGLSMSYEIITKGHGGELTVKTVENEGTDFIISLPSKI